ncbi:tRNA adenosine(34) deaminase TadA [Psychrobacter sp. DM4]|uniref:tRNA adenosine(34) deaminase TadA n=1 Tax=Psychrobacter sp. DM4 TaxID=3440637 RepID=UPI003F50AE2E
MTSTNNNLRPLDAATKDVSEHKLWCLDDVRWMAQAIDLARLGATKSEVPVGAILVHDNQIIGQGFNEPIGRCDATAHAEIIALREACSHLKNYRLPLQTTLYVTLEPCTMCIGALIHARVDRLIYATSEPRAGMVGSQMDLPVQPFYNHRIQTFDGLYESQCSHILKSFFRQRRQNVKKQKVM